MIFTPFLKIICSNSDFSEEVLYYTSGCAPSVPASPVLTKAGVTWLSLQWTKPSGTPSDEGISYILEMEEETSGYGFKPKYDGEDLAYTVKNLRRSTKYKFKVEFKSPLRKVFFLFFL